MDSGLATADHHPGDDGDRPVAAGLDEREYDGSGYDSDGYDAPADHRRGIVLRPRPSLVPGDDDLADASDPADSVVAVGEVPPVAPKQPIRGRREPMPTDTVRSWVITGVLGLIGALVRFWQLGFHTDGGTPLFDGKYYAVQAAEMIRTGGVEDNQAFGVIVHPPLGKQIIAVGEMVFGYNSIGWRVASAVCGVIAILVIIRAVRRMTRSTLIGGIAGILLICDGVSQTISQIALMDSIIVPFIIGAFACLLVDRDQVRDRLALAVADGSMTTFSGGVPLGARWGRFAAGFLLGCATAVKWNGAYWIVGFGLMSVVWDICARRDYGVRSPVAAVTRRDLAPSLWSLGIVPVLTYIGSYWAWFANETGWDRHAVDSGRGIIGALRSLSHMTGQMLETSAGILTPTNPADRHPWESKPFSWPLSARPLLTFLSSGGTGCGPGRDDCVRRILIIGTPILWWVSLFVAAWALWRAIGRVDWRFAAVLVGYGAGFLPWFTIFDRQMYFFYMAPVAPFLVIGIALVAGDMLASGSAAARRRFHSVTASVQESPENGVIPGEATTGGVIPAGRHHAPRASLTTRLRGIDPRTIRMVIVAAYVGLVVANFVWMWPILMGDAITPERLEAETWIPSWG